MRHFKNTEVGGYARKMEGMNNKDHYLVIHITGDLKKEESHTGLLYLIVHIVFNVYTLDATGLLLARRSIRFGSYADPPHVMPSDLELTKKGIIRPYYFRTIYARMRSILV